MKKLITLILTLAFAVAAVPVEAAQSPSLDFLKTTYKDGKYTNVSQNGSISFKLNKPIPGTDYIDSFMSSSNSPVDIKELVESLFGSTITYSAKQKTEKAGEKITTEMNLKSNAPIRINKNLELLVNASCSLWMDLDTSDKQNISLDYIMSTPVNKKYITMNLDEYESYTGGQIDMAKMISDLYSSEENITNIQDSVVESISENARVTGNAKNVKIVFSDLGLKKTLADIIDTAVGLYDEEMRNQILTGSEEFLEELKNAAINIPFFADDALVIEYKLDSKNRVINEKFDINVDLDLFKLASFIAGDTEGLVEGESNVSFSISGDTTMKYNAVSVKKPELTGENSISITELTAAYDSDYEETDIYSPFVGCSIDENFSYSDSESYIPLRGLLEELKYEVTYDNGIISAVSQSKYTEYKGIVFDVKSNVVRADGADSVMSAAPKIMNDRAYITLSDAEKLLNFTVWSYTYYPNDKEGYIDFERNAAEEDF